jgi:rhodanese-related sulfurtransferase
MMAADHQQQEVPPQRVAELMEAGEAQVVDVRTDDEHAAGRIGGAEHIPFEELPSRAGELDQSRPVVFYCQSGGRSSTAAQAFGASGWEAYTMTGGLEQWAESGLPLEPEGARVTHMSGLPDAPAA